jgi:hypothetical protein
MCDLFEGPRDAAVSDLDREQERYAGSDADDRHDLAKRLHSQVAPVEEQQRSQVFDHPSTAT